MSNSSIIERLRTLADDLEAGRTSIEHFADVILGHTEALEQINYRQIKEAQMISAQLRNAIHSGDSELIDVAAVVEWVRQWTAGVPA